MSSTYQTTDIQTKILPPHQSLFLQALTPACIMKRYKDPYMHTRTNNQSQIRIWAAKKATNSNLKATTNLKNIHKKSKTQMTIKTSKFMTTIIKLLKIINIRIIQMMMNSILMRKGRLLIESWHNKAQRFWKITYPRHWKALSIRSMIISSRSPRSKLNKLNKNKRNSKIQKSKLLLKSSNTSLKKIVKISSNSFSSICVLSFINSHVMRTNLWTL